MFIALVIATVLLAAMCASSASQKLHKHERSVAIIGGTVGVPVRYFPQPPADPSAFGVDRLPSGTIQALGLRLGIPMAPIPIPIAAGSGVCRPGSAKRPFAT